MRLIKRRIYFTAALFVGLGLGWSGFAFADWAPPGTELPTPQCHPVVTCLAYQNGHCVSQITSQVCPVDGPLPPEAPISIDP